ncbi:hypothetical protein AB2R53_18615 [Acinetobacter baumannii]|uniref:hypothetical protein n=1 Tax=Acinetobacter baumannii TaxID=470 RepID=UPI000A36C415|nr:hypothetical protein [Acinetobacter baumannii]EHU2214925.1 hypothetical protein [Acinetobacter baumannii]OTU73286.1 hypothetical protein CAT32_00195 [Acinetobacter baumannii]TPT45043.1 hypothetical protein FJU66_09835 [Acinetobacter baumannii]
MDNYKIKVNDEAESKEAQELFFELGYSWLCCGKYYNRIGNYTFITAYPDEMLLRMGWGGDTDKELTLPQLRDLVVLKRNDVKDATHTGTGDSKYYVDSNGDSYIHNSIIWTEWKLDISILKPIKKHLETATGRFDENGEHHLTFSKGSEEKDPALISIDDVWKAFWKEQKVQYSFDDDNNWQDDIESLKIEDIKSGHYQFRLKPQTIKVELEIPAPYKAKIGGRDDTSFVLNVGRHQYCYQNEEDYTKARDALEAVFDAAVRGTNS